MDKSKLENLPLQELAQYLWDNRIEQLEINMNGGSFTWKPDWQEDTLSDLSKEIEGTCRQIFIDEVDWSEWAIDDEKAGEIFDKALAKHLAQKKEEER
jgi:hypothetical protein